MAAVMKQNHCTSVSVALGGSWRAMEEENQRLSACLRIAREESQNAEQVCQRAMHAKECAYKAEAKAMEERECAENERDELRSQICTLRKSLLEASQASAEANERIQQTSETCMALNKELASCRQALEIESDTAIDLRVVAAAAETRAARECDALAEMTASQECVTAELHVAESRLSKRATHVDLLLRDKERLWSQVSRLRKRSDECGASTNSARQSSVGKPFRKGGTDEKQQGSPPTKAFPTTPTRRASTDSVTDLHSPTKGENDLAPGGTSVQRTPDKAPLRKSGCNAPAVACNVDVLELQKANWHLQKALDRERAAHEHTREKMLQKKERSGA